MHNDKHTSSPHNLACLRTSVVCVTSVKRLTASLGRPHTKYPRATVHHSTHEAALASTSSYLDPLDKCARVPSDHPPPMEPPPPGRPGNPDSCCCIVRKTEVTMALRIMLRRTESAAAAAAGGSGDWG